jgi:hypothetical protein
MAEKDELCDSEFGFSPSAQLRNAHYIWLSNDKEGSFYSRHNSSNTVLPDKMCLHKQSAYVRSVQFISVNSSMFILVNWELSLHFCRTTVSAVWCMYACVSC